MKTVKNLLLAGALAALSTLLMSGLVHTADPRDPAYFFDRHSGNLQHEAAVARYEGKSGVIVMFEQENCTWCAKMRTSVLNQAPVQDYYRKYFRILSLDIHRDVPMVDFLGRSITAKEFASLHQVRSTPVFIFFDANGKQRLRYTGATRSVDEFVLLGEFVVQGDYKSKSFTAYQHERMAQR